MMLLENEEKLSKKDLCLKPYVNTADKLNLPLSLRLWSSQMFFL